MCRTTSGSKEPSAAGIFQCELFRIVIGTNAPIDDLANGSENHQAAVEYKIHKPLLTALSPEFDNHVNNGMREGVEGVLVLREVDAGTVEKFLEWAYSRTYRTIGSQYASLENRQGDFPHKISILVDRAMKKLPEDVILSLEKDPELLAHAKLYVFADRFNVQTLKSLAWKNIQREMDIILEATAPGVKNREGDHRTSELNTVWLGSQIFDEAFVKDLMDLISYCCENFPCVGSKQANDLPELSDTPVWLRDEHAVATIPKRGGRGVSMNSPPKHFKQPLLDYLVKFCAWQWDLLQQHAPFTQFIFDPNTNIEFRSVFFANLLPSNIPPNRTNHSLRELQEGHPLSRYCTDCGQICIPNISCPTCRWDTVEFSASETFTKEYEGLMKSQLRALPVPTSPRMRAGGRAGPWKPHPSGLPAQYMCHMPSKICSATGTWQNLKESMLICRFCRTIPGTLVEWEYSGGGEMVVPRRGDEFLVS